MTTLNDLLDTLKQCDPELKVTLDGNTDIGFESWRGIYSNASIVSGSNTQIGLDIHQNTEHGFAFTDARNQETIEGANTVGEVIAILEKLIAGGHLQGYKGGWYAMGAYTTLYADEYSRCPGAMITEVVETEGVVDIKTAKPLGS